MDVSAIEPQTPAPQAPAVSNDDIADVLLDQVDDTITKIEVEKSNLLPLEHALDLAMADLANVQAAKKASTKPELLDVYGRAEAVAQEIVNTTRSAAIERSKKIEELQNALRTILQELKKMDPENPLVQKI